MRPQVHFTSESGWINDPHGITYRDGEYHVFYQYVPGQTVWGPNCHWGHASGPDLLSLKELPVAIAPGDGDDGIWTGSLVTDEDRTIVFYTSTSTPDFGIGRVRQATPDDEGWMSWSKGPFVADAPADLDIIAYRDPFIRRDPDGWRMFLGAALRDGTATALSYTSSDLNTWQYEGITLQRSTADTEGVWMGALWECPQFFDLDGHAVMVSSVWDDDVLHYAGYALGTYSAGKFEADSWGRLTYGKSYYAPSLFMDAEGRPCLLFWMRGIGGESDGWASAHSVPYLLGIRDGALTATPHPDVALHRQPASAPDTVAGSAADITWSDGGDGQLEVISGGEKVASFTRAGASLAIDVAGEITDLPVAGPIRLILDGQMVEVSSAGPVYGARIEISGEELSVRATAGVVDVFALR